MAVTKHKTTVVIWSTRSVDTEAIREAIETMESTVRRAVCINQEVLPRGEEPSRDEAWGDDDNVVVDRDTPEDGEADDDDDEDDLDVTSDFDDEDEDEDLEFEDDDD